ncbi:facilitated trehalose transporter Tret1 isoform X3 [Aricia agestis]|nr:facilitated trehalose transporter Tret1 isoform X3 [Aricia agestis]
MGSVLNIGAILGPFIGGFLSSNVGRKWGLLASFIPLVVGWVLVIIGTSMWLLYIGRVCWGIAVGMLFTIGPMYCAEIATTDSRGALGSFLQLFITFGFLFVYGVGPYAPYNVVAFLGLGVVVVAAVLFFFMPETPTYYLLKGNRDAAAESLMKIRGRSRAGVEAELSMIAADVDASLEKTATLSDVFKGSNFKAFYISCTLVMAQQLCGINAVLFYMTVIFESSGLDIADIATIIIGAVQVVASAITPFAVDRLGRRILLLISTCGTAVGLALLGMFFILKSQGSDIVDSISFLPILALVLFIITYCWGLGPLPWAIMSELFPIEVKTAASPIVTAFCWILSFIVTMLFPMIPEELMYLGFFIFCVCCVCSFFFVLFVVPETKGKSFQEIQEELGGGKVKSGKA